MDFSGKITSEDLMTRILPGGFFLAVIFFSFGVQNHIATSDKNLDFLYSFMFLCLAFMTGEIIQTITHSGEFLIDIFYKGYRPSELFLFKNNPIITNERTRVEILNKLIPEEEKIFFDCSYENFSFICSKKDEKRKRAQKFFWKMYSEVESQSAIQRSNVSYLFLRAVTIEFFILFFILFWVNFLIALAFLLLAIIFLWRARGLAKGLVFKVVNLYLKK